MRANTFTSVRLELTVVHLECYGPKQSLYNMNSIECYIFFIIFGEVLQKNLFL